MNSDDRTKDELDKSTKPDGLLRLRIVIAALIFLIGVSFAIKKYNEARFWVDWESGNVELAKDCNRNSSSDEYTTFKCRRGEPVESAVRSRDAALAMTYRVLALWFSVAVGGVALFWLTSAVFGWVFRGFKK